MIETPRYKGIFTVYDNPWYKTEELELWVRHGKRFEDLPGISILEQMSNILMASQKLAMANAVFPNIDKLVITNQTSTPVDSETSYSGTIYTSVPSDEFYRSANANPYRMGWNITASGANGTWGSFVLITPNGTMINRALAGVTKDAGTAKIVDFQGSVT